MKRKAAGLILVLVLIMTAACGSADFGSAGNMISPATLVLVPESRLVTRIGIQSSSYSWSYAPSLSTPEKRRDSEADGPAATDPETEASAPRLKLPGISCFSLSWISGYAPDAVSLRVWDAEVFAHQDRIEDYDLGVRTVEYGRVALEPGRVYQVHAEWGSGLQDRRYGQADYTVITEAMTEEEISAAEEREAASFSEEDLLLLTLKICGADCVLGSTSPQELADRGLYCMEEEDGTFAITDEDGWGFVYAATRDGTMDSPIVSVNAYWSEDLQMEYCGFVFPEPEDDSGDDDDDWAEDDDDWPEDGEDEPYGDGDWFGFACGRSHGPVCVDETVEGIYETVVTLSNGRELGISTHDSGPGLKLLDEKAVTPLISRALDPEGGTYALRIEDADRIDTDSFFTAALYREDHYTQEELEALRIGERIRINGTVRTIAGIRRFGQDDGDEDGEPEEGPEEGETGESATLFEIGIRAEDGFTDYFYFRPVRETENRLYYAQSLDDWVPVSFVSYVTVSLPLPGDFSYTTISAGEETEHSAEEFLAALRENDPGQWSQYNTEITFRDRLPVRILHSGYPQGPDAE